MAKDHFTSFCNSLKYPFLQILLQVLCFCGGVVGCVELMLFAAQNYTPVAGERSTELSKLPHGAVF